MGTGLLQSHDMAVRPELRLSALEAARVVHSMYDYVMTRFQSTREAHSDPIYSSALWSAASKYCTR